MKAVSREWNKTKNYWKKSPYYRKQWFNPILKPIFNFIQESIKSKRLKGILNYTPSYNKLIINFDLEEINSNNIIEFIRKSDYSNTVL